MIRLTNIKRDQNIMSATVTIIAEHPVSFELVVDVVTGEILENTYGEVVMSVIMARKRLIQLYFENEIPESIVSAWF